MLAEAIGVVAATTLLIVLPGWLLLRAFFPDPKSLGGAASVYLTLAGGILVLMTIGIVLGFLPHGSRGAFQSIPLEGMPNVELATIAACLLLFWVGARRGAYARIRARLPWLVPARASKGADREP